jgi:hypothetical protein
LCGEHIIDEFETHGRKAYQRSQEPNWTSQSSRMTGTEVRVREQGSLGYQ